MRSFRPLLCLVLLCALGILPATARAIGIRFAGTPGGILQDAILFASAGAVPSVDTVLLGDLDLGSTSVFDVAVDPSADRWWLLGHQNDTGDPTNQGVSYSSNLDLQGIDLLAVPPFDVFSPAIDIPSLLNTWVATGMASADLGAQISLNHGAHTALDGETSTLWTFTSPASELGLVAVSLHTNTPPQIGPPGDGGPAVPEPTGALVFGIGLLALRLATGRPAQAGKA